jgi:thiol:disulfide interchange protein DsbD
MSAALPLLFAALWLVTAVPATAKTVDRAVQTERTRVTLIADHDDIRSGRAIWIGFHFELARGWHTYWRNPGDAGNQLEVSWDLPEGLTVGITRWPQPHRLPSNGLMSFGYEDEVVLLTRMSAFNLPSDAETIELRASASWMVCAHICIPEEGEFTLTIDISADGELSQSASSAIVRRYQRRLPKSVLRDVDLLRGEGRFEMSTLSALVSAQEISELWFFPYHYGHVEHAAPQPWRTEGERVVLELTPGEIPLEPSTLLEGLLVARYRDGAESSWRVSAPTESPN